MTKMKIEFDCDMDTAAMLMVVYELLELWQGDDPDDAVSVGTLLKYPWVRDYLRDRFNDFDHALESSEVEHE